LSFLRYGMPALLGQIVYMGWISRARTLPLFIEATHTVTCFAVTATLLSAIVKPFGRPFKITDKGGDRSAPRVHWKLAAVFGLIAVSPTSVRFSGPAGNALELAGSRYQIHLEGLGWTDISMVSRFRHSVLARLEPTAEQYQRLVVRLFSASHGNIAGAASLRG